MRKINFKIILGLCITIFIAINSIVIVDAQVTISRDDVSNESKVKSFVNWWLQNDQFVNAIGNRSVNIYFKDGYYPKIIGKNPEEYKKKYKNLPEWFIAKIYLDLQELKNCTKEEFKNFVDDLTNDTSIMECGMIAYKYNLNMEKFVYEIEINKIPDGKERETFKQSSLDDDVISSNQEF